MTNPSSADRALDEEAASTLTALNRREVIDAG